MIELLILFGYYDCQKKNLNIVLENYKINNWNILNRATYYKNKQLIFTFPEVYKKFWDSKQIKKIEKLFTI